MTALEKAQNLLVGAEACWQSNSLEGCALCCYAAMFWATIAALEHFGIRQTQWTHGGLQNRFGLECIKKCKAFPERFGDYLIRGYRLRARAHYERDEVSQKEAERLLRHAKEVGQTVKEVLGK
ncbi:MAG: HEPN domain-containing protein [Candidatus Bathyarchaeia archaeon]